MDQIFQPQQIEVPRDLPGIMKTWSKEIIRHVPENIVMFSREYFEAIQNNSLEAFLMEQRINGTYKGPSIDHEKYAKEMGGFQQHSKGRPMMHLATGSQKPLSSQSTGPSQAKLPTLPLDELSSGMPDTSSSPKTADSWTTSKVLESSEVKTAQIQPKPSHIMAGEGVAVSTGHHPNQDEKHGKLGKPQTPVQDTPPSSSINIDSQARKREIYKKAFDKFDEDHSGQIDIAELKTMLDDLGWDSSEQAVATATGILDADGNGTIDLEEFLDWTSYAWDLQALGMGNDAHQTRKSSAPGVNRISMRRASLVADFENGIMPEVMEEEDDD